ncbi:MAG: hypothetical protein H6557_00755 [Lewinellaceae bacterium]|nr:hypothetical protein [Phaeodactylibacter sp.]MCB9035129.1 hypothetical protein [Lewinellaceae bacterium]
MKSKLAGYALFLLLLPGGWACKGEPPSGKDSPAGGQAQAEEGGLVVVHPNFQLREEPGNEALAIRSLQTGERAVSLGQQSAFTTPLQLGGQSYNEPWLLVQMEDGAEGWVYALAFLDIGQDLPREVRLRSLFGPALAERLALYEEAFQQAHTAEAVAQAMAMGRALRDTLVQVLALRAKESGQQEGLFWLQDAIPAFVPHRMEDGRSFYLFMDFRPYLSLAQASEGLADDALLELYLMAYPEDSVEYFYPAWVFQANEKKAHSLLGRGLHFRFLEKLDKLLVNRGLFEEEIGRFREQLLNDMVGANVTYWESREKASAELERILQAEFQVLGPEGQEALNRRLLQFKEPEKYGIKFNYRSGIYGPE